MFQSVEGASDGERRAAYVRHYAALAVLAEELGIPEDEAGELIAKLLLAMLVRRPQGDLDRWLAAALRHAWQGRR